MEALSDSREAEILGEIREAEKRADEIIERANREKESLLREAAANASKLLSSKKEEIEKAQEKKIMDFREKAKLIGEEKSAEGKMAAKQLKLKSEKNTGKAVDFILKKFEDMVQNA